MGLDIIIYLLHHNVIHVMYLVLLALVLQSLIALNVKLPSRTLLINSTLFILMFVKVAIVHQITIVLIEKVYCVSHVIMLVQHVLALYQRNAFIAKLDIICPAL